MIARRVMMNDKLQDKDGTQITCEKCKGSKLSGLTLYGKSKQVTTTGAQLIELKDEYMVVRDGVTIKILDNGCLFVDGTPTKSYMGVYSEPLTLSPGEYYFLSDDNGPGSVYGQITIEKEDGSSSYYCNKGFKIDGTEKSIRLTIQNGNNMERIDGYVLHVMLSKGNIPLPWEPYTGGKPSPSPDYPQEIESVGTKWSTGANLVDVHNAIKINAYGLAVAVKDDGTIIISGTSNNNSKNLSFSFLNNKFPFPLTSIFKCFDVEEKNCKLSSVRRTNTSDATNNGIAIDINQINSGNPIYCSFKLVVSEKAVEEYEPYTGGVPKPYGDKIRVEVRGKNLLDPAYAYQNTTSNYRMYKDGFQLKKGVTYTLSCYPSKAERLYINGITEDGNKEIIASSYEKSFVMHTPSKDTMTEFNYYSSGKLDPKTSKLMLEIGENPNPSYEPYHEPQTTDIATPNGLPGIPVASGGNYTDADGQKWICDEVDFAKGVYVQNIKVSKSLNKLGWFTWGVNKGANGITGFFTYDIDIPKIDNVISNIALYNGNIYGGKNAGICASIIKPTSTTPYMILSVRNDTISDISSDNAAIQSFKDMLAETDAYMMYVLATPIETPLTSDQLAAYKQLHTYADSTAIISNDANAHMGVTYRRVRD